MLSPTKIKKMVKDLRSLGATEITVAPDGTVSVRFDSQQDDLHVDPAFFSDFIKSEKEKRYE